MDLIQNTSLVIGRVARLDQAEIGPRWPRRISKSWSRGFYFSKLTSRLGGRIRKKPYSMVDRIEEPYALLTLPKPFGGNGSQTQATAVWQYSSLRSRLRSEVVVAVDGEGLYIYDVSKSGEYIHMSLKLVQIENPRLITSYAVPPETKFLCKPVSLIRKRADRKLERVTYAAVQLRDNKANRLLCFVEERKKQTSSDLDQTSWKQLTFDYPDQTFTIQSLHAVPVDPSSNSLVSALHLCAVHSEHTVESYAGDLSRRHFSFRRESQKKKQYIHEYATTISLTALRKGLLRDRQDVTAALEDAGIDARQPNILFLIRAERNLSKERTERTILLARLTGASSIDEPGKFFKRHGLLRVRRLPKVQAIEQGTFHLSHDGLHLSAQIGSSLRLWNLTEQDLGPAPFATLDVVSHLNLGHSEVIACTADTYSLVNTQWQAVRAEFRLQSSDVQTGEKRSRDPQPSFSQLDFVQYFPESRLAVALATSELVGLPIDRYAGNKKRRTEMTLADSVGRGQLSYTVQEESKLAEFSSQVKTLVESANVAKLEAHLATDLGLEAIDNNGESKNQSRTKTGRIFASSDGKQWLFPKDDATLVKKTNLAKAHIVMQECIGVDPADLESPYFVRMYSDSIFRWFAINGLFASIRKIEAQGALLSSLAEYDTTLATMETVLRWNFHLEVAEVVRALSIAIDSLDSPIPRTEQIKENGETTDQPDDDSIADAEQAAEEDLAFAIASLNHGTAIRSGLLKSIFDRLFAFPAEDIVDAFKTMLTPRELVFLINLLRIELADGGWTTRYTDEQYEDDAENGPADSSISIIIKLLNSAIDAVGPTGWNVGLSSDKQLNTDEMLLVLRAEINAALDGCQEYLAIADSLQGFTKFCALAQPNGYKKKKTVDPLRNPGFVKEDAEDVLLPMGGRLDRIDQTRVSKGGRVNAKSKSLMGQEISMRVGRYSKDKIRV